MQIACVQLAVGHIDSSTPHMHVTYSRSQLTRVMARHAFTIHSHSQFTPTIHNSQFITTAQNSLKAARPSREYIIYQQDTHQLNYLHLQSNPSSTTTFHFLVSSHHVTFMLSFEFAQRFQFVFVVLVGSQGRIHLH